MMGPAVFSAGLVHEFSSAPLLPAGLVGAFGYALPYAESILGFLILFGIFTRAALALAGLLLVGLTFGIVLMVQTPVVANNLIYSLVIFMLLFFAEHNFLAFDNLHHKISNESAP